MVNIIMTTDNTFKSECLVFNLKTVADPELFIREGAVTDLKGEGSPVKSIIIY